MEKCGSEMEVLQDSSESSYVIQVRDGGTDKKRHGAKLEVKFKELKILGFALGVNRLDRIMNGLCAEEMLQYCHSALKPRLVEGSCYGCPSRS